MEAIDVFQMPSPMKITGRKTSITNAFANSIIPVVNPTNEEVGEALHILGLSKDDLRCSYCGDRSTEWDHLRPLILKQQPTGYISEIRNLVPCCGKCNQSKGNKNWRQWIQSTAPRSPKTRGVKDLQSKVENLEKFEKWGNCQPLDLKTMVGEDLWASHWTKWSEICNLLKQAQEIAQKLNAAIRAAHKMALAENGSLNQQAGQASADV
jgi:hypothetical protein